MKYLIIGNGPAGTYAARAIRQKDATGTITILSNEKNPFYSRPRLPEFIEEKVSVSDIMIFKPAWYEENRIDLILEETVQQIIPADKAVITESAKKYPYNKLLIATGSVPNKIEVPGIERENIFTLRTVEDAVRIREIVKTSKRIVVIGGGLLGLEAAYSLARVSNSTVTVVEFFNRLLPRQLDEEGAAVLRDLLAAKGMRFELGAVTGAISGNNGKKLVEIKDGRSIEADFILVSTGIKIPTGIFQDTGISLNKGILVNDHMESNCKDIYAAGDCAEHNSRIYGLWTAALDQGRTAGSNMAGEQIAYRGTTPAASLKAAGIELASIGEIPGINDLDNGEYKKTDPVKGVYKKLFIKNGILKGAILIGNTTEKNQIQKAIGLPYHTGDFL